MAAWSDYTLNGIDKPFKSLYSFGDSFTYGDELADCNGQASNHTWPALIGNKLGCFDHYGCHAEGGRGNQHISYNVFRAYARSWYKNRNFFIINWTWIERFDYLADNSIDWHTLHPRDDDNLSHFFYKNIDNQCWNLIRNLQIIYATIQFLESHACKFFMTCIDDNLLSTNYHLEFAGCIATLQSLVRPYINHIENKNFLDWSKDKNFTLGPGGHPLEEAHQAAADYLIDVIKHQLHFAI